MLESQSEYRLGFNPLPRLGCGVGLLTVGVCLTQDVNLLI